MSGDTSRSRKEAKASLARMAADAAELEGWTIVHRYQEAVYVADTNGDQFCIEVRGVRSRRDEVTEVGL